MRMAGYRQCVRCCIDTTVPGASFDGTGVCSFCHLHDRLERDFPIGSQGQQILEMIATRIRRAGHGKRYDCVVGISGGRDSSYTLHMIVRELRLRPLATDEVIGAAAAGLPRRQRWAGDLARDRAALGGSHWAERV